MQFLINNFERKVFVTDQLPINFSHTIDARIERHACMVPLKHCDCGNMFEICLQPPILI